MKKVYYKGFDENMRCKNFQYEVGKEYKEDAAKLCNSGFHACENPFDTWRYYSIANSRFAEVELGDVSEERLHDSKRCGRKIKIKAEIGISGIVEAATKMFLDSVDECQDELTNDSSGNYAKIGSCGDYAKIGSSGVRVQIGSRGDYAQIGSGGDFAQIGSSGHDAKIGSNGHNAQIGSCGDFVKIGSSGAEAKIGSSGAEARIGSSGNYAKIGSRGNWAQIGSNGHNAQIGSCGDFVKIGSSGAEAKIGSSGGYAVIAAIGENSVAKAKKGSWITLAEYDANKRPICVKTEQVDGKKIKENVFYTLKNGEFKEVATE